MPLGQEDRVFARSESCVADRNGHVYQDGEMDQVGELRASRVGAVE